MARDVEVDAKWNDKTSPGIRETQRKMREAQKSFQKQQDEASSKFGKNLGSTLNNVAPNLTKKLVSALDSAGQAAGPLLAGGLAAAAPVLAGTLQAAVIGGAGIGGVLGGVLLVSRDARVKAAGGQLADSLLGQLQEDASPFIQPVLNAVDQIGARAEKLDPLFKRIFTNSARYVEPLTTGLLDFAEPVLRGFDKLVAKAGPVIASISAGMAQIGEAAGDTFSDLANNSDDAARSLDSVFDSISGLIRVTGPLINGITSVNGLLDKMGQSGGALNTVQRLLDLMDSGDEITGKFVTRQNGVSTAFQAASDDAYDYAAGLRDAQAAVAGVYEANRDLYSSTTDVAGALDRANKAAKDNGDTLSLNTQKGRDNRDALSEVAGALQRNYDGYIKVNGAGAGANALAGELRGKFVALAEKMGASSSKAQELANKLLGIPNVDRHVNVQTAQAQSNAAALKAKLEAIKDRTVYVNVAFNEGRLNKVEAQLARVNRMGLAGDSGSWSGVVGGGGSRTGGPTDINLMSRVDVSLDGRPFRAMTTRAIDASNARQAWRTKVGSR